MESRGTIWRPATESAQFVVTLRRFDGTVRESYHASLEKRDSKMVILRAAATKKLVVNGFTIEKGDQIRQYFLLKEWFYVQEYLDSNGNTKAWYCNIGTPVEIHESTVTCRDLILDIFVDKDRKIRILDENELEQKRELIGLATMNKIIKAKKKLLEMIRRRSVPFLLA